MSGDLAETLARFCPDCGEALPRPGAECARCPQIGTERQRVMADYKHQLDRLRAIDAAENAALLAEGARRARRAVRPVREGTAPLRRAVEETVRAEREAEDRCRASQANLRRVTRAEEKARRDMASAAIRTEALVRMQAAASVVQGDQAAAEGATAVRKAAEQALSDHLAHLARLEDEAVTAEWAAGRAPAIVPPSIMTCLLAHPLQVLMLPDLGPEGRALVSAQVAELAKLAGVADEIRAEGHAAGVKERDEQARNSPVHLQAVGDGKVAVTANIAHPSTPQPSWAPGRTA